MTSMTHDDLVSLTAKNAVAIVSGGMDSTVLAYLVHQRASMVRLLSFDYGQRHRIELEYARRTARALGAPHHVVDLTSLTGLLAGSALTDENVPVPDGHYSNASMRATVVPNRNAIMLDIAVAQAVSVGADAVVFGAHAGDHPIYPDCRPEFLRAFQTMALLANQGFAHPNLQVTAPFIDLSKAEIATIGERLGVPFADTWSCYRGGVVHCGSCGTCVERREAFVVAGLPDPTVYANAAGVH